jgi:hypothetical protein
MIRRLLTICVLGALLGGCAQRIGTTSIEGGEARVFERPEYAIRGATQYDQNWIDSQIEGGVAAFGWERPKPRPPELDAKPLPAAARAAPKKKSIFRRARDRVSGLKPAKPVEFVSAPIMPAVKLRAEPPVPARKRDAVDELLGIDPPLVVRRAQ